MNAPSHAGPAAYSGPWLTESVTQFFSAISWDGKLAPTLADPLGGSMGSGESPMRLKVSDFFGSIPWDGKPVIAAPIAPLTVAADAEQSASGDEAMTLDGFFDLF